MDGKFLTSKPTDFEGISFHSGSDLNAIDKKIGGRSQYLLLSFTDLDTCYQRSQMYICEKQQVIRPYLEGSSLGAIYIFSTSRQGEGEL